MGELETRDLLDGGTSLAGKICGTVPPSRALYTKYIACNKTHDHCEVLATYKQSSSNFQSRVSFQAGAAATFIIGNFH